MQFEISGQNVNLGEALRTRIRERISKMLEFHQEEISGHLTVSHEGTGFRTQCVINFPGQHTFQGACFDFDVYISAEGAMYLVDEQIQKYVGRRIDKRRHPGEKPT
jgi:ribosomal subunit interface protein